MVPKLYIIEASPPARAVIVTAAAVGVQLDIIIVEKDYLYTDEFLKLNPQHTVPVLIDEDKIICDSHVIVTYLIQKYAKDDLLYPSSLSKRILVDQRLYYDASIMFPILKKTFNGFRSKEFKEVPNEIKITANEVYDIFEKHLTKTDWLAGDHITVADISCYITIKSMNVLMPYDSKKYAKVALWAKKLNDVPYFSVDGPYFKAFVEYHKMVTS
ncbi:hypothetical protein RN001_009610 [Aquatica leii]|uniref:Uncharacterized protein n=1 Tax=Aquatica leii TaxID=1421715 RepID=A0AAN7P510_9COLE|nr:hypothetical protein RN001_009610 [Aquatica leii]